MVSPFEFATAARIIFGVGVITQLGSVAAEDPMAMFALGWLAHERDAAIARCAQALLRLRRADAFWT